MKNGAKDHTGRRFGRLVAVRRLSKKESGLNKTSYECLCDCGNVCVIGSNNLVSKITQSCGCLNTETLRKSRAKDYTGQKFNRLLAVERIQLPKRGVVYRCLCDCGNEAVVAGGALIIGNTKSCGCLNLEKINQRNHDPVLIQKRVTNCSNSYEVQHWKTFEVLKCQGKWERNVIDYLNANSIDFTWQIPFFLPDGRTYIVDFLDLSRNVYVEIKGQWRDDAKDKFNLFVNSNSSLLVEVWDQAELKKRNIPIR